ncbi:hypothetical protein GF342_03945 [Candidatus Woesearchaeota archaeon]|nr:hypothetical protein [Candidatus Woesearchaeota archaeon]
MSVGLQRDLIDIVSFSANPLSEEAKPLVKKFLQYAGLRTPEYQESMKGVWARLLVEGCTMCERAKVTYFNLGSHDTATEYVRPIVMDHFAVFDICILEPAQVVYSHVRATQPLMRELQRVDRLERYSASVLSVNLCDATLKKGATAISDIHRAWNEKSR